MAFMERNINGVKYFISEILSSPHAFTTRIGGVSESPWDSLNLGPGRGDNLNHVKENYRRICEAVNIDFNNLNNFNNLNAGGKPDNNININNINSKRVVLAKQVHETDVKIVDETDAGKGLYKDRDYTADALITDKKNLPLFVFSADCGIILLEDKITGTVGAVHAGWRGCAGGIVKKAVDRMCEKYGADRGNICAAVGPCIGSCCFETDQDVPDAMRNALGTDAELYYYKKDFKWHVDLAGLNKQWLLNAGLVEKNIDICGLCTACRPDLFWSHRKMGERRGVQAALICGINNNKK